MELRTIVVDDEPFSRQELVHLLKEHENINVAAEANSAEKALELILREEPDAVFLDIEMTGMSGVELAETLQKLKKPPSIIFATAYPDYAVKAFRLEAVDYLLKPFDEVQVAQTVNRLIQRFSLPEKNAGAVTGRLAVQSGDRILYLEPGSILYIYKEGRDTFIVTEKEKYPSKIALKELEGKLKGYSFFRVHKGYLVNMEKVEELVSWSPSVFQLKLTNSKDQIPVSRNYVKELREALEL
ncbi:LytR/AlgR family response regulator transcription factor [Jeotgalibacillus proteolyticus]|uniref:DNA-binding response regulator n=1 Tax=Jeotgalibacillus proteolyticus TaxID=2082395 RepID=A0A2S5GC96_9BACL|nr:LytTR family DNA-binding domain-containing protein [Jeotgalibacillus proteolyticus]PPA70630.1 DNA-binding response regulator [Jeotgalibacillus proteolyticus]